MKSIAIIIPYFGPLPKQFKFWLKSAYNNPSINYIIITDNAVKSLNNVKIINLSLLELKSYIQEKFEFDISLDFPYKLCDYRPAYGFIFNEYIKEYDFWGFGDLDLVYGNIRHFITDSILSVYSIILGFGHLTLYRNTEKCNYYFMEKIDNYLYYKDAFTVEKYYKFDEFFHRGMSDRWKFFYPNLVWDHRPFDDVVVPRLAFNFISAFNESVSSNLIFQYTDKNLYRIYTNKKNEIVREQTLYAHFQQRSFLSIKTDNTNEYLIIPNAYIDNQSITLKNLLKWGKSKNLNRLQWNLKNKIKRRVKKIEDNFKMIINIY